MRLLRQAAGCQTNGVKMTEFKCQCSWIDQYNRPTPDRNDAVALASNHDPRSFQENGSAAFPICEEHARRRKPNSFWKLLPLPNETAETAHTLVKLDAIIFRVVPDKVIASVKKEYPTTYSDALKSIKWCDMMKCFYWMKDGVYHGVEENGNCWRRG